MMRFDPFTPDALEDPYPQYSRFRAREPVHWSEKLRSWVLFRYADVATFFRDDRRLSSERSRASKFKGPRAEVPHLRTVASDPPAHTAVRSMLAAALNPRVRSIGPRLNDLIAALLDRIAAAVGRAVERAAIGGEFDLVSDFAHPLPINVNAELLDIPESDRPQFGEWSRGVARGMDRFYSESGAGGALQQMGAYFYEIVLRRSGGQGNDLVHRLLDAEYQDDRLSDLEVVALCTALVFGGHETTANLIGNGMLALLRHPDQLDRLRADPGLIDCAVEELLRFDSPAQMISRTAVTAFEWDGHEIQEGDAVVALLGSANRDPDAFAEPDALDISRSPNPHIAFGLGAHFCPGAQLSRLEARAAISALLRRFPHIELATDAPARRATVVLRSLERLPLRAR